MAFVENAMLGTLGFVSDSHPFSKLKGFLKSYHVRQKKKDLTSGSKISMMHEKKSIEYILSSKHQKRGQLAVTADTPKSFILLLTRQAVIRPLIA